MEREKVIIKDGVECLWRTNFSIKVLPIYEEIIKRLEKSGVKSLINKIALDCNGDIIKDYCSFYLDKQEYSSLNIDYFCLYEIVAKDLFISSIDKFKTKKFSMNGVVFDEEAVSYCYEFSKSEIMQVIEVLLSSDVQENVKLGEYFNKTYITNEHPISNKNKYHFSNRHNRNLICKVQ